MASKNVPTSQDRAIYKMFSTSLSFDTTHLTCKYIDWTPKKLSKLRSFKKLEGLEIQGKLPTIEILNSLNNLENLSINLYIRELVNNDANQIGSNTDYSLHDKNTFCVPSIKLGGIKNLKHLKLDESVIVEDLDELSGLESLYVSIDFWLKHRASIKKCTNLTMLTIVIPRHTRENYNEEDGNCYHNCHDIEEWVPGICSWMIIDNNYGF